MPNRRKVLIGLGGSVAIAGCTGETDEEEPEEEDTTNEPPEEEEPERESEEEPEQEPEEDEPEEEETTQETQVEITVDWTYLEGVLNSQTDRFYSGGSSLRQSLQTDDEVTHVGVRLEYPEHNAAFSQATAKGLSEIITLNIPPADNANLYAVAVVNNEEREEALLVSKIEGLEINEDANNQWASEDLDWTTTGWFVKEEHEEGYERGEFYVDKEEEDFRLHYYVTYPFHSEQDLTYEELLVRLSGKGWIGENTDEYHEFYLTAENPSIGESSETEHSFVPYVVSEMFSLPPARYEIKPKGEFTVVWE